MTQFRQFPPATEFTELGHRMYHDQEQTKLLNSIKQILLAILIALILIVLGIWLPALLVLS